MKYLKTMKKNSMKNKQPQLKETKVEFIVEYTPIRIQEIGKIMKKMDLGIEKLVCPKRFIWTLTTTSKVDEIYIAEAREMIESYFNENKFELISITLTNIK